MVEKSLIKKNCIGFVLYLVAGLSNEAVYITHFFMPFAIHLLYTFFKTKCITLIFKALKVTVLYTEVFLKRSQNLQENTCARVSFLIKLQVLGLQLY